MFLLFISWKNISESDSGILFICVLTAVVVVWAILLHLKLFFYVSLNELENCKQKDFYFFEIHLLYLKKLGVIRRFHTLNLINYH